ncbi:glycoside hydrolase family 172 protein [Seonamhaeicola maritimus]|uniref:glycoside hydrolase family 172 protein n=1 Tax=Seonamhaeicola maritimus TaxID=2591822 RepID=UPI002494E1E0|nr:DUF2961 domain-containing protein [Seonamhaeicola maritimus]
MKYFKVLYYVLFVLVLFFSCTTKSNSELTETITTATLLKDMVNRAKLASFPKTDFRLKQESSYNRESVKEEAPKMEPSGWFKNHDYNSSEKDANFIRIEEHNGEKEWVLMDHKKPGVLVRTWMPFEKPNSPDTDNWIRIYLDGAEKPTFEGNMLKVFNGTGFIPFPLAHKSLRSAVSFFPIPYSKSCKITTSKRPFFYQFTFREYKAETKIKTFSMEEFNNNHALIKSVSEALLNPKNDVRGHKVSINGKIKSNNEQEISLPKGQAAIHSLSLKLDDYQDPEITRKVVLKIEFDGHETVWCPIGDFFGSGIGLNPFQGWYRTVSEDGALSCRWVMPYKNSGKVSLLNLSNRAINVSLEANIKDWKWDSQSMYFNAAWKGQYPVSTRPFSDWNYITIKGRGVYVGDALTIMNPVKKWWGEGDERIWVDNEMFPSIFGTGTEDYYAYSWGGMSTDFYEHPFHAQPHAHIYNKINRKKESGTRNTQGYSTETRTRALDVMPFGSNLKLDMEVWSGTDCEMGYGVGMYWYGDAGTESNRKPDIEEVLNVPPLPDGFPND